MSDPTLTSSATVEDRLQPWIDQAEYLILLIMGFMAWSAGWVNLLSFQPFQSGTGILGRYPLPIFVLLVAFTVGFGAWLYVIVSLRALHWLKRRIAAAQRTPLVFVLAWIVFIGVVWSMIRFAIWRQLPLLQASVLILFVIFNILMLLTKPQADAPTRAWQKIALGVFAALFALEIILQALAAVGALPITNVSGLTVPYGRIYQTDQGFANGRTNQYGWYYPDLRLEPDSRRIILNGDTFIQAVQINTADHLGVQLERLISAQPDAPTTEIIVQGMLGYSSGQFLSWELWQYIWEPLEPAEIVVFFHMANDWQTSFDERGRYPRVSIEEDGSAQVERADRGFWHTLAHITISGHDPANPILTVFSHWLTYNIAADALRGVFNLEPRYPEIPLNMADATPDQPFGAASFIYTDPDGALAEQAYALAAAQIATYADYMAERGVRVRLVTIPYFPAAFFAQPDGSDWDTVIDGIDLSLPEARLRSAAAANGVPFLSLLETMQAADLSVDAIAAQYFDDGAGHFTPDGHTWVAQALFACFYDDAPDRAPLAGCYPDAQTAFAN